MTDNPPEIEIEEDEEGSYFRATGVMYLHIERGSASHEAWLSQAASPQSQGRLDPIALKIINYRSRLHYDKPEIEPYLIDLLNIVDDLHTALLKGNYSIGLGMAQKQSVIVSGSELEFLTEEKFASGETVTVHMTFTEYPFTTLVMLAKVADVQSFGAARKKNRVRLAFHNIREADRDSIIRYVNQLQRRRTARHREESPKK